ncbi:MAG: tyrosine recombinase [Monoglobaceae bacterium]
MEKAVEDFLDYMKVKRNASVNTLQSYRHDISKFSDYLSERGIASVTEAGTTVILDYLLHIQTMGNSAATASRTLSAIKSMYKYMVKAGEVTSDPTDNMHGFKAKKKMPSSLTEFQINVLLDAPSGNKIKTCRDKAILELLYATGMRVSDLLELKISDVNLKVGYIYCSTGNNKERIIPIYAYARECIGKYVERRSEIPDSDKTDILFLNLKGKPLTRQGVWKMVKKYQRVSGLSGDITPHTLRHTFAMHLLENGADIKSVQEMMGHSDIASTLVYREAIENKLNEVYNKSHPRTKHSSGSEN